MFVSLKKLLIFTSLILSSASYSLAQFQWNFGCAPGSCATANAPAYGMPPAGVHDVGGNWQWNASRGQQQRRAAGLYNQYCVRCHGVDGRGVWDLPDVPNFADPVWQSSRTDEQLARLTWEGRGATMPAFRGTLTWDESWSLAHYIRELAYQMPSQPRRNQPTQSPNVPTPAIPSPLPTNPGPWQPVSPRPLILPSTNPTPIFAAPHNQRPIIESPVGSEPSFKPTLNPPEDSMVRSTEVTPPVTNEPVTDELLDKYFKEKPAGPNIGTPEQPVEPVEELPAPRQSNNELNLPTYNLSAPILGSPTQTVMESPSEIELRSYPAAIVSPLLPQDAQPKNSQLQSAVPPYPISAPPGPRPAVKRDFSSPLYRTR